VPLKLIVVPTDTEISVLLVSVIDADAPVEVVPVKPPPEDAFKPLTFSVTVHLNFCYLATFRRPKMILFYKSGG
jgi:hypothetical protein